MKKIFAIVFFISAMCAFTFAQSRVPEFEKVKKIKFLESTRKDVKKILKNYKADDEDGEDFSSGNIGIEITYTEGNCSEDDSEEMWNVSEGRVKFIKISFYESSDRLKIEDLGFNVSNFLKEKEFSNIEDDFIYSNKNFGIAFKVDEDGIQRISLFPSKSFQSMLCENEEATYFYSNKSWFGNIKLEDRQYIFEYTPSVSSLTLSATEIILGCETIEETRKKNCRDSKTEIEVTTNEENIANDVLTYEYKVSGGKIIGKGKQVIWDLYGVKPGTYTITAGVNDGCGICGATKTETVVIKECDACSKKK